MQSIPRFCNVPVPPFYDGFVSCEWTHRLKCWVIPASLESWHSPSRQTLVVPFLSISPFAPLFVHVHLFRSRRILHDLIIAWNEQSRRTLQRSNVSKHAGKKISAHTHIQISKTYRLMYRRALYGAYRWRSKSEWWSETVVCHHQRKLPWFL